MENELYTLYDLIETETNEFNIFCKSTGFYDYVKLERHYSFLDFRDNFYYTSNGNDYYTLLYGENQEDYLEYLHSWDNNKNLALGNEDFITSLGLVNPLLLIKLIDNEETIKKLLKLEKVTIDCNICTLEITPITQ